MLELLDYARGSSFNTRPLATSIGVLCSSFRTPAPALPLSLLGRRFIKSVYANASHMLPTSLRLVQRMLRTTGSLLRLPSRFLNLWSSAALGKKTPRCLRARWTVPCAVSGFSRVAPPKGVKSMALSRRWRKRWPIFSIRRGAEAYFPHRCVCECM